MASRASRSTRFMEPPKQGTVDNSTQDNKYIDEFAVFRNRCGKKREFAAKKPRPGPNQQKFHL
jgi:hypothetical protein